MMKVSWKRSNVYKFKIKIKMAILTRQQLRDYWNTYINTNGAQAITGQLQNKGGIDIIDSMALPSELGTGLMNWKGEWSQQEYNLNDVVRDGIWTSIANQTTTDRPAPIKEGPEYYLFDSELISDSATAKHILAGQRVTTGPSGGYLTGYRVHTAISHTYEVYIVYNPLTTPVFELLNSFKATIDGWNDFNAVPILLQPGAVFDIITLIQQPTDTPIEWSADWDYQTPQNAVDAPIGTIQQSRGAPGTMYISKTDNNSVDRTIELAALSTGDKIRAAGQQWAIQSIISSGTYFTLDVIPAQVGTPEGITTFTFETVAPTPIKYGVNLNYWITNPSVQGLFTAGGSWENIVPDESQYISDIKIQNASISDAWDIVAISGGSGAALGGGWEPEYTFDKVSVLNVNAVHPAYERLNQMPYTISAGETIYEFKLSITYTLNTSVRTAFFRFSIDNGVIWEEFQSEPKDITDKTATFYAFPKQYAQVVPTDNVFLLEAAKENALDVLTVNFADVIVERVK